MRQRYQQHSLESNNPHENSGKFWDSLWKDRVTPWDLGHPTEALVHELESFYLPRRVHNNKHHEDDSHKKQVKNNNNPSIARLRTLVPGCGAGYDLIALTNFHDNLIAAGHIQEACVVGLDLSETSLQLAAQEIESAFEFSPMDRPTRIKLVRGDYLNADSWEIVYCYGGDHSSMQDPKPVPQFDLIFDYTFMTALDPSLRSQWAKATAKLLNPATGYLLTLMFPLVATNNPSDPTQTRDRPGPPFAVTVNDYRHALEPNGLFAAAGYPRESEFTVDRREGQEQVCWWSYDASDESLPSSKL
jgi:hypothetical protein